ncbi:ribosomal protein S19 family protein [Candidatus Marsarchaeota archaeon]|jgi:Ribosomal protein S19|nr:ribosomal protein S19 family protein [Candidatus Marsarchaeota archaeon]MCL5092351.1 ribosomal protein S19 family protein [Candidatus Marsarchaeota archaeon]
MVERIAFKGKMPGDIPSMSSEEYLSLIKSRQRRWIKRNSLQYRTLIKKVEERRAKSKPVRTQTREAVILPSWIGMTFEVYSGKEYQKLLIEPQMLGHRLGEFVYTTKRVQHSAPGIKATRGSKFLSQK